MSMGLGDILTLAQYTLQNPRKGLRRVLDLNLSSGERFAALALMAVAAALLGHLSAALLRVSGNPLVDFLLASPLRMALIQGAGLLVTVLMVHFVGRFWGGRGQFDEAVLAVAWLQFFLMVLQLGELISVVIGLPQLGILATLVSLAVFPWLLTMFVAEIHGFSSPIKVFFGILGSAIALSFGLSFLLVAILGPEAFTNV